MRLIGNPDAIAAYHTHSENYYFKQASEYEKLATRLGLKVKSDEQLDYVTIHGRLCSFMGLNDGQNINEETFSNLLCSKDTTGKSVCRRHKVIGIDLTFSAPKSVSITALVNKDSRITQAHDKAVLDTMAEIEKNHSIARPTSRMRWHTGKMVYATVRDGFSREHDPHLHTHVVVMNLTEWKGKVMGLWSREILNHDFNRNWDKVYQNHLGNRLKEAGYNLTCETGGQLRIDKISKRLEHEFSTRNRQIVEAEKGGQTHMGAWHKTRKRKQPLIDKERILNDWQARAERCEQKTEEQNRLETVQQRQKWSEEAKWSIEAEQERNGLRDNTTEVDKWQLAIRRATDKSATASKQALTAEYLIELMRDEKWQDITYKETLKRLEKQVEAGYIVEAEEGRYTSWEMMKADREYMNHAGLKLNWTRVTQSEAKQYIDKVKETAQTTGRKVLSEIQSEAVKKMITSNTRLTVVQGDAGSGKTTALRSTADFYKEKGIEVVGLTMQGIAARNLEDETDIKSKTLVSFFRQQHNVKQRVIVFDEASMLDSRNASKLFKIVEQNGDKIILVGDINQLQSISAGKVFERLVDDSGRAGDLINLNENFRQKDEELRKAVDYARKGQMKKSLDILDERKNITEIENTATRRNKVAELYNINTLIITGTTTARDEINLRIRSLLKLDDKTNITYKMTRADKDGINHERELKLTEGDIIAFSKNDYKNYDVRNGERGEVKNCNERYLTVELEDKRTIKIDTERYKHIDYGYALTTYKSQGQTYDKVVIEADTSVPSLNDMRNQYVNITRARENVKIFTDDKKYLKELSEIKTHARDTLSLSHTFEETKSAVENIYKNGLKETFEMQQKIVRNMEKENSRELKR
ncbi:MAG: MobF family relaxase [Elusimicrobiota bacterium]